MIKRLTNLSSRKRVRDDLVGKLPAEFFDDVKLDGRLIVAPEVVVAAAVVLNEVDAVDVESLRRVDHQVDDAVGDLSRLCGENIFVE